jgi:hypothetical protein
MYINFDIVLSIIKNKNFEKKKKNVTSHIDINLPYQYVKLE